MAGKSITQMRQERDARRSAIAAEGLRTGKQVMARFGVSEPTALADLRAVYGTLRRGTGWNSESMLSRRKGIAALGLRTIAEVKARFSVSRPTARRDMLAVYGEVPSQLLPERGVHTNFYLLESQQEQLRRIAAQHGCSMSDILRQAVEYYLSHTKAAHA